METDGVCKVKRNNARRCVDNGSDFISQLKTMGVGSGAG